MQSFRQYRQIRESVRAQYESKDLSRQRGNDATVGVLERNRQPSRRSISSQTLRSSLNPDPEKEGDGLSPPLDPDADNEHQQGLSETEGDAAIGDRLEEVETAGAHLGRSMTGVEVRQRTTREGKKGQNVFIVDFQGENDPINPHKWPYTKRIWAV
jgi:hypothetical protein